MLQQNALNQHSPVENCSVRKILTSSTGFSWVSAFFSNHKNYRPPNSLEIEGCPIYFNWYLAETRLSFSSLAFTFWQTENRVMSQFFLVLPFCCCFSDPQKLPARLQMLREVMGNVQGDFTFVHPAQRPVIVAALEVRKAERQLPQLASRGTWNPEGGSKGLGGVVC